MTRYKSQKYQITKIDRRYRGHGLFSYIVQPKTKVLWTLQIKHFYDLKDYMTDTWGPSVELGHWMDFYDAKLMPGIGHKSTNVLDTLFNQHWCYEDMYHGSKSFRIYLRNKEVLSLFLLSND